MKKLICFFKGHVWSKSSICYCYETKHCLRCNKCKTCYVDLQKLKKSK